MDAIRDQGKRSFGERERVRYITIYSRLWTNIIAWNAVSFLYLNHNMNRVDGDAQLIYAFNSQAFGTMIEFNSDANTEQAMLLLSNVS